MFKEELNGAAGDNAEAGSVRDGDVTVLDGRLALDPGHPGATALGERIGIEGGDSGERPDLAAAVRDDASALALGESVDGAQLGEAAGPADVGLPDGVGLNLRQLHEAVHGVLVLTTGDGDGRDSG